MAEPGEPTAGSVHGRAASSHSHCSSVTAYCLLDMGATQADKIDQWPLQAGTRWALVELHDLLDVQALHGHLERRGNGDRDQCAQDAKGDATEQEGDDDQERMNVHTVCINDRHQDVRLKV